MGDEMVAHQERGVNGRARQAVMRQVTAAPVTSASCARASYLSLGEARARRDAQAAGDRRKFYVI